MAANPLNCTLRRPRRRERRLASPAVLRELPGSSKELKYENLQIQGQGSYGVVYSAKINQEGRQRYVALKVRKCKRMRTTEAIIHCQLHHPNVVEFSHNFMHNHTVVSVLEWCPNGTLSHLLEAHGRLPEASVRAVAIQLLGAVKFCHGKGVVHRDLKPENVFVGQGMRSFKIGDFGMARVLAEGQRCHEKCGSWRYMAPEVHDLRENGYGRAVDVWSVGVMLKESLDGIHPFGSRDDQSTPAESTPADIRRNILSFAANWRKQPFAVNPATMVLSHILTIEADRWLPDELVGHEFFTTGEYLSESGPAGGLISVSEGRERNASVYWSLCKAAGVGNGQDGRRVSCAGTNGPANALKAKNEGTVFRLPWSWDV